jgi:hypothetical protein
MPTHEKNKDLMVQLAGWVLFVICAILFIISGIRMRDVVSTAASIMFFLGCVVFIVPLLRAIMQSGPSE